MGKKLIFILLDGLNYETAVSRMGFMQHLVEKEISRLYKIKAELPSLSRPLYETIFTGTPPYIHGVVSNVTVRRSREKSIFELAREHGLKTAAAAYYWMSELYNRAPFDLVNDREQINEELNIQYGKYYFDDAYPDSHLFIDGEILRKTYDPDFLLIHPMGIDYIGHLYGSESKEYKKKAMETDLILAEFIPQWINQGYQILVTSDHGMNQDGNHGGVEENERMVPLWAIGSCFQSEKELETIPQIALAPMICKILNMQISEKMIDHDLQGWTFCE